MTIPLLLVDVGNTRTKIALAGSPVRIILRALGSNPDLWAAAIEAVAGPPPWRWAMAGVHPSRMDTIRQCIIARGERLAVVRDHRDVPIEIERCDPAQVGVDRLLDVLAARERKRPGVPAITIDMGTATVVNVISAAGRFQGGGIMPGLTTMASALADATAKLPRLDAGEFDAIPWPGTTTIEAMAVGCYHATLGGIERMIDASRRFFQQNEGESLDIFLTGGHAEQLAHSLTLPRDCERVVVETLTLDGLLWVVTHS